MEPHVIMLPSPGMGHLIPLIEFAKRLITHNFTLTFLIPSTSPPTKPQLTALTSLPPQITHIFLPPVTLSDLPNTPKPETTIILTVNRSLPSLRTLLPSLAAKHPLSALVTDQFGGAAFPLAKRLNIPPFIYLPCSATTLSIILHAPTLHRHSPDPVRLPGCRPIPASELPDPFLDRDNDAYRHFLAAAGAFVEAEGVFVNSFPELEPDAVRALQLGGLGFPAIYPVGPLVRGDLVGGDEDGAECLDWLDEQPTGSVLFVSFGSGGTLSRVQMEELAMGLEMSGQRFVWVVRKPSETEADAAFFTVYSETDPLKFLPEGFVDRNRY